jgi:predicted dehydrogenase
MSAALESKPVRIGIIGGGLMGREIASAFARWFALDNFPVSAQVTAVCDLQAGLLDWFRNVPTIKLLTTDYQELISSEGLDVVYVAVPHHLHEEMYINVLRAGKDLLAEKPFGIDLAAARRIRDEAKRLNRFVRVSSEFPFLPGAQKALHYLKDASFGQLLSVRSGFLHSSDLDPTKHSNWKRQEKYCGRAGAMNDLGMHAAHIPLRLGWKPASVYAELRKGFASRPDGKGGSAACDTWDNATLHTRTQIKGQQIPMTLEMKRMAPTETNSWYFEVMGMDSGVRYSTKEPKTFWHYARRGGEQWWEKTDLGFSTQFKTITGGIFEPGFPDILMQMWAAFLAERAGLLGDRFGCATPDEAVQSHEIWEAALISNSDQKVVTIP